MNKHIKRLLLGLKIYWHEFLYIIKVWLTYIRFKYIHHKKEPKSYFYESFKNNTKYTQICHNSDYRIDTEHYKYYNQNLIKFVKTPYKYFQLFSSKEYNFRINKLDGFFQKKSCYPNYKNKTFYILRRH